MTHAMAAWFSLPELRRRLFDLEEIGSPLYDRELNGEYTAPAQRAVYS
jgi:hypothetical protein